MWRMGVPVATPVSAADCLAAVSALIGGGEIQAGFENELRSLLGTAFVRGTNSGRSALFLALKAIRQSSDRDEVIIPAFVCPSVGRAVVKAGLKPILCDVGPDGSGLDLNSLERAFTRQTLAVVTAHLYGYPTDITTLAALVHSAGAMVIEDAAQAFGAKAHGRYVGTMGDAGVFSFGMSKVLGNSGGGLVTSSNPELARHIDLALAGANNGGIMQDAVGIAKLCGLAMLVRCHYLGPLAAVWGGTMRGKNDCDDFRVLPYRPSQAAVAQSLLRKLSEITRRRQQNADYYSAHLAGYDETLPPNIYPGSEPVFLRFPIIVKDIRAKKQLLAGLQAKGINASEMYTRESYESLRGFSVRDSYCPRTEYLAERMLNLPTHCFVRTRDLRATVDVFHSVLGRKRTEPFAEAALSVK